MAHLHSVPTAMATPRSSGPAAADEARRFIARSLRWERRLEALRRTCGERRAAA